MIIQPAKRTESVKEYYFSIKNREMARLNAERKERGEDPIINLGIGSPDGTPPRAALNAVSKTARLFSDGEADRDIRVSDLALDGSPVSIPCRPRGGFLLVIQ